LYTKCLTAYNASVTVYKIHYITKPSESFGSDIIEIALRTKIAKLQTKTKLLLRLRCDVAFRGRLG
jgi:hypothetical protein